MAAEDFFGALRQCSVEVLRFYSVPTSPGGKTKAWQYGKPRGITFHYTAGVRWKESANWLNSADNKNSSCHFIVLDRQVEEVSSILTKYPELSSLPVLVIQLADLSRGTWHATWVNGICVGIENRNAGMLKKVDQGWCWWAKNWTARFPADELGKVPVQLHGKWWEPYTRGQLEANIIIGQKLHELFDLDRRWLLPHSAIDKNKQDTGPAFPLQDVREAIISRKPLTELSWLAAYASGQLDMRSYLQAQDNEFMHQLSVYEGSLEGAPNCAFVEADFKALITSGSWRTELDSIRRALSILGYVVGFGRELDEDTKLAVYAFQKSQGLETDGVPGERTQAALAARLKELGISV